MMFSLWMAFHCLVIGRFAKIAGAAAAAVECDAGGPRDWRSMARNTASRARQAAQRGPTAADRIDRV